MTKRQAERTPGLLMIVMLAVSSSIIITFTVREALTGDDSTGFWLGVSASILILGDAVVAVIKREGVKMHAGARVVDEERERRLNTGTWKHPDHSGMECQIRYDTRTGVFYVSGWVSEFWMIAGERAWPDLIGLTILIRDLENEEGMTPADDEGTRSIKARLMAPGWNEEVRSTGIHPRPDGS